MLWMGFLRSVFGQTDCIKLLKCIVISVSNVQAHSIHLHLRGMVHGRELKLKLILLNYVMEKEFYLD